MEENFNKVKNYLLDLDYELTFESLEEGILIVQNKQAAISNLVIGVAEPLLILEQYLFTKKDGSKEIYKSLLIKNRDVIHGAFVLDETGEKVLYRDTLQIENLDLNELEGTLNALSLLLSEYSDELIKFSLN